MTDLTPSQRVERATRATRAMEEFFTPAFDVLHAEYTARLKAIAASEPWASDKITALANATRILEEVRGQVAGLIHDGEQAKRDIQRIERLADVSPAARRLLAIGPV